MKVQELIDKLQEFDPEREVVFYTPFRSLTPAIVFTYGDEVNFSFKEN